MELDVVIREKVIDREGYIELFIWYLEMVYVGLMKKGVLMKVLLKCW